MNSSNIVLQMKGITKRFPGTTALNNVDLELNTGEVLGLLGENGAGKSTLIKILSGAYRQDEGEIFIEDEKQIYSTPKGASEQGISIIYQELNYLNDLTVAENIFLNRLPQKKIFKNVDWDKMHKDAKEIIEELGISINPQSFMRDLSVSEKQIVEIAKAISQDLKILVMDEPTSALSEKEVEHLLSIVKQMASKDVGVIYISHHLEELFKVADRVQVLRDGEVVGIRNIGGTNREDLVSLMVGRKLEAMYPKKKITKGEAVLEVKNLSSDYVKEINFTLHRREILGVFGLMGAGQSEMAKCIFGAIKKKSGEVELDGKTAVINSPSDAIEAGIAYLSDERKKDGLILIQSVKENISTASINNISRYFKIDKKLEKKKADDWISKLGIKTPNAETLVESLSGGNQQKVVLSKWLETNPKVLILNNPTRGIDVGAKVEIYNLMENLCEKGLGVIMLSYELPEILELSDRILVMSEGRIVADLINKDLNPEILMHNAVGDK